jgi:hypothetical protein
MFCFNFIQYPSIKVMPICRYIYWILAGPGHEVLWLIPVQRKRTKREVAHVSYTFNVPMPVGKQYFCGSICCADI